MRLQDLKNKKIAVVGEGLEGKSSASFLKKQGAQVTVLDIKQGKDYLKDLDKFNLIVRSPGVKLETIQKALGEDEAAFDAVTSQTKLFFDLAPGAIIGVTGTKGKGTTSALIYEMLKADGRDAYLGGNIGVPPFEFLEKLNPNSWTVLEMSSFQLQDLTKSPHIAVVLMITRDHLDGYGDRNYHDTVDDYVNSKRNILNFQSASDFAILNRDYLASNESDVKTKGKIYFVSREREVGEGCFALGNQVILRANGKEVPIIDTDELLLKGPHNQENACA